MAEQTRVAEASVELRREEERVEARSAALGKELGLWDLVLTQVLFIVGLSWVGVAGKLGPAHVVFWLLAIGLFYVPSALVVIHLNTRMPLEGGLYQWAKLGFSEAVGFLVAWNLWLFVIVNTSGLGLQFTTYLSYVFGEEGRWMTESKWFVAAASCLMTALLVAVSIRGLRLGKWVHNAGGLIMLAIFATLLALPIVNYLTGHLQTYRPLDTAAPPVTLDSLNILGKLGFGALGGFEYVAILAGEAKAPARTIGRSVRIAAPVIALMFILGTSSVLAFIPVDEIDLIGPIPQVLSVGFRSFGHVAYLVSIAVLSMLALRLAQASVAFTAVTRLPMVAGWDRLLPEWFTRLHARHRTPVNSILVVGLLMLLMGLLSLVGVGQQEAFQLLHNAGGIFYALAYLVMFALPLAGLRRAGVAVPLWLKAAAGSGFLMTLLYVTLSIFPIIRVESRVVFAAKIVAVILVANAVGAIIYLAARRKGTAAEAAS